MGLILGKKPFDVLCDLVLYINHLGPLVYSDDEIEEVCKSYHEKIWNGVYKFKIHNKNRLQIFQNVKAKTGYNIPASCFACLCAYVRKVKTGHKGRACDLCPCELNCYTEGSIFRRYNCDGDTSVAIAIKNSWKN